MALPGATGMKLRQPQKADSASGDEVCPLIAKSEAGPRIASPGVSIRNIRETSRDYLLGGYYPLDE